LFLLGLDHVLDSLRFGEIGAGSWRRFGERTLCVMGMCRLINESVLSGGDKKRQSLYQGKSNSRSAVLSVVPGDIMARSPVTVRVVPTRVCASNWSKGAAPTWEGLLQPYRGSVWRCCRTSSECANDWVAYDYYVQTTDNYIVHLSFCIDFGYKLVARADARFFAQSS